MGNVVARTEELATEAIEDGLLVYDLASNDVHWLDATVTEVWRLADGSRTAAEIGLAAEVPESGVLASLEQLVDLGLAIDPMDEGLTRRLMIRKVAITAGAAAAAGPIISSIVAPTSAEATTTTCDATKCSGTGTTAALAQAAATAVCVGTTSKCRTTSTCSCTPSGSGTSFTCGGSGTKCIY